MPLACELIASPPIIFVEELTTGVSPWEVSASQWGHLVQAVQVSGCRMEGRSGIAIQKLSESYRDLSRHPQMVQKP